MRTITIAAVAALLGADLLAAQPLRFEPRPVAEGRWWKGNTHAHTLESDGDSPPETVVAWYKAHGYAWLVLSDHNVFTDPVRFRTLQDSAFLLIPGEELTSAAEGKAIHVNGLNLPGLVRPESASTILETVQRNVDAVRRVEGVPHVNHPNFLWSIGPEVLARLERDKLFELYNGHPIVHNEGGGDRPSMEAVWDTLLARGKRM
ncbi:MAG: hypothetical protein K2X99_06810 [Gemmatimonadaceae bacterium]|nr:hypothetical protein [Gemmatimonadaceae bacterium]